MAEDSEEWRTVITELLFLRDPSAVTKPWRWLGPPLTAVHSNQTTAERTLASEPPHYDNISTTIQEERTQT